MFAELASDSLIVAPRLIGAEIATDVDGHHVRVRINEVEAYGGPNDPASHAYRGLTPRNAPMFGPAGTVYVYLSYGVHWCVNVVTGPEGSPLAVLIRGGNIVSGHKTAIERRGRGTHLADGPGKLCQALGIDGSMSGTMLGEGSISLMLNAGDTPAVETTPRIGISKATEELWRFVERAS